MAGDGEEQIVVEWGKVGELVDQHLWNLLGSRTLPCNTLLDSFWKKFVLKFTEPGLEHRANDVDIVEIRLLKEVDIEYYKMLEIIWRVEVK